MLLRLLTVLCTFCWWEVADSAPVDFVPGEDVKRLVASIENARAQLRSGRFECDYEVWLNVGGVESKVQAWEISVSFHRESQSYSLRQRGRGSIDVRSASSLQKDMENKAERHPVTPTNEHLSAAIIRNAEYMCPWIAFGKQGEPTSFSCNIELFPPTHRHTLPDVFEVDADAVGMYTHMDIQRGHSMSEIVEFWAGRSDDVSVIARDDGKIDLVFEARAFRRSSTIDPARGWTCESSVMAEPGENGEPKKWPVVHCAAEWSNRDGIWIPITFTSDVVHKGGNKSAKYKLSFRWQDLNLVSPDSHEFSYHSLSDAWPGTFVIDRRADEPVAISRVTKEGIESGVGQFVESSTSRKSPVHRDGLGSSSLWISANLMVMFLLLAFWILKIRK